MPDFIKPDKKVTLEDVMELQRNRGESTQFDANRASNIYRRPIGVEFQAECHIVEMKGGAPDELAATLWLAMGNAEHTVYVPFSSGISETPRMYQRNSEKYIDNSAYWTFKKLSIICSLDRPRYGEGVRAYWREYQRALIGRQAEADAKALQLYGEDKQKAMDYVTKNGKAIAREALSKSDKLYRELLGFISANQGHYWEDSNGADLDKLPKFNPEAEE
jgi:dipeptidase